MELRCSLAPLSRDQIRDYIKTRLRVAGSRDLELFSDRARDRIAAYSRGIPRRVNILCDHCLVIGYADQRRRIDVDIVDQALESLHGPARRRALRPASLARRPRARWFLGGAAAAVFAGIAVPPLRVETEHLLTLARHVRELFLR
jgi:general secretion pathway protein A